MLNKIHKIFGVKVNSAYSANYYCGFSSSIENRNYVVTYKSVDNRRGTVSRLYKVYFSFDNNSVTVESYRVSANSVKFERLISWDNLADNIKDAVIHSLEFVTRQRYIKLNNAKKDIRSNLFDAIVFSFFSLASLVCGLILIDQFYRGLSSEFGVSIIGALVFIGAIFSVFWTAKALTKKDVYPILKALKDNIKTVKALS